MKFKKYILLIFFMLFSINFLSPDNEENEPITIKQDVSLLDYEPWNNDNKIIILEKDALLKLSKNWPIMDGATALYPVYVSFANAVYINERRNKNTAEYHNWFEYYVHHRTTEGAYYNLINGEVDIIFCAEPSKEQIAQAAEKGIEFHLTPIGKDAFVFFVNKNNPINNITSEQIRNIYSGKITNWYDINGINEPIIAYQRPKNSGSQTILESIMEDNIIMEPIKENVIGGMGGIVEEVSSYRNYKNAIGYSFLFFTTEMVNNNEIKLLSIDGVYPSKETIQNNEYPFSGLFYAITVGNETKETNELLEWILSDQGQYLVEKTGYVPIK